MPHHLFHNDTASNKLTGSVMFETVLVLPVLIMLLFYIIMLILMAYYNLTAYLMAQQQVRQITPCDASVFSNSQFQCDYLNSNSQVNLDSPLFISIKKVTITPPQLPMTIFGGLPTLKQTATDVEIE